jgi:hypothetical protein
MKQSNIFTLAGSLVFVTIGLTLFQCGDKSNPVATPPPPTSISFDASVYQDSNAVGTITLVDANVTANTVNINVKSTADQTGITVVLTKGSTANTFSGSFSMAQSITSGASTILVSTASKLIISYEDNAQKVVGDTASWISMEDLYITDQVTNWNTFTDFGTTMEIKAPGDAYDLLNGGADVYIDSGLVKCMPIRLVKVPDSQTATIRVDLYPTATKANNLFKARAASMIDPAIAATIGSYTSAEVQATYATGSMTLLANFGRYFFVLELGGYSDKQTAVADAVLILNRIKSIAL